MGQLNHFVVATLAILLSVAHSSPIAAATNSPIYTGTCAPVSAVVSLLHAQTFASSFCSSFLPITTHTASTTTTFTATTTAVVTTTGSTTETESPLVSTLPTVTFTAPNVSITVTTSPVSITGDTVTITASTITVSVTNVVTTTVCAGGPAGPTRKIKREPAAATSKSTSSPTKSTSTSKSTGSSKSTSSSSTKAATSSVNIPSILSSIASSKISSACSCLNLPTPTTTSVISTTVTVGTTQTSGTVLTISTTPIGFYTPTFTLVPTDTIVITPTVTVIPSTTFVPTETDTVIATTTVTVGAVTGTPSVVLASPTPIFSNNANYDDNFATLSVPFPLTFYGVSSSNIIVAINGFVSLAGTIDSQTADDYTNQPLPDGNSHGETGLPDTSVLPFWDDLYIYQGTPQGVYYEVDGLAPQRNISFEWYTSHYQDATQYYHFIATFQEAKPGIAIFSYYQVSDLGVSATVGAQSIQAGQSTQYSFNTPDIAPGLQLTYNMQTNSFQQSNDITCAAS